MKERRGAVTFTGNPLTLLGEELKPGAVAPNFTLLAADLSGKKLSDYKDKALILATAPSLDTGVCDLQTKRFNKEAGNLSSALRVLTISCDLPFAQSRWCGAAGVSNLEILSDHLDLNFGLAYGVAIKELRLLTRAAFVLDEKRTIVHVQIVPEITHELDFNAVLDAARRLIRV